MSAMRRSSRVRRTKAEQSSGLSEGSPVRGGSGWGQAHLASCDDCYRITPTNQIDLHMGLGLTWAAPDVFVGIAYSFRIDHVR